MKPKLFKSLVFLVSVCFIVFPAIWFSPALSKSSSRPATQYDNAPYTSEPQPASSTPWSSYALDLPALPTTRAIIRVSPSNITAGVGTNVTVRFVISNASEVFAWQLYVRWDSSVLKFVTLASGDFLNKDEEVEIAQIPDENVDIQMSLSKVEVNMGTFRVYRLYEDKSRMLIGETRVGNRPGVSGNGTLCSVVFQVLSPGSTTIDIATKTDFSSYVIDSFIRELPSTIQNGFFIGTEFTPAEG